MQQQLAGIAAGRAQAAAGLYDCLGRDVFAVAAAVTGRRERAEQVVVETFREVATLAAHLRRDPDAVVRILSLTQRLARDHARSRPLAGVAPA